MSESAARGSTAPGITRAIRATVLSFHCAPPLNATQIDPSFADFIEDGLVLLGADGKVAHVAAWTDDALVRLNATQCPLDDWRGHLITPGLVDTHVHYAQLEVIASYGTELLDWLETYTFPAERRFSDPAHAARIARLFVQQLLANGTTTAAVWPTVHAASVDALFDAALAQDMRVFCGKIMMDRHCPEYLQDTVASAERDCVDLIQRWHGRARLGYAVTPRFAVTSSPAQLQLAGELFAATPGALMQTHVAENKAELEWVARLFPSARSYLDVYDQFQLLGKGAQFGHGIWLDDTDRQRLADTGSALAFCPTSNLFLGSGLFDYPAALQQGIAVGMASDVGGGTSLSMLETAHEAYKVQALRGNRLSAFSAFYSLTLGGALALQAGDRIGRIAAGYEADLVVWRWASNALQELRIERSSSLHEKLFTLMMLGGAGNVASVYVNGRKADRNENRDDLA